MLLEPECIGCLVDQIYKGLNLLSPSISKEKIIETQKKMMEFLIETDILNKPGPLIGKRVYQLIAEVIGKADPYKDLKDKYNHIALEYYAKVKDIVKNSEDPLFEAIAISAIGNTIDFGAHHTMDLINDIKTFTPENFKINDFPLFKESLEKSDKLLMLLDNAGEIVFDKLLVETLLQLYPNLEIICAVRAGPIINDATMEDAEFIGLTEIVKTIKSPASPGIEFSIASDKFKTTFFDMGGIILSKGQGNFESLHEVEISHKEVYYLLKAKCSLMERIFNVKIGDLIFKKKA